MKSAIDTWLEEPGYIRTIELSFDCMNRVTCRITEADSQPEYYAQTSRAGLGVGHSIAEAHASALESLASTHTVRVQRDQAHRLRDRLERIHANVQKHPQWDHYTELLAIWSDSEVAGKEIL